MSFFLLLIFDTADEKVAKSHIIFFEGRTSTFVCVFVWVYPLFQFKISFGFSYVEVFSLEVLEDNIGSLIIMKYIVTEHFKQVIAQPCRI